MTSLDPNGKNKTLRNFTVLQNEFLVYYNMTLQFKEATTRMAKTKVKVIMEKSAASGSGGCGAYIPGGEAMEERQDSVAGIRSILQKTREQYGESVEISVMDPRSIFSFIDNIRYNIKGTDPTWIVNGKKVFEGVPSWEEWEKALKEAL